MIPNDENNVFTKAAVTLGRGASAEGADERRDGAPPVGGHKSQNSLTRN